MADNIVYLTDETFKTEVLGGTGVTIVDFWAPWCGPCRMIGPVLEELAKEYDGKLKVGKVNVDEHQDAARQYGIASIPTLLLFKDGQLVDRAIGAMPKPHLEQFIKGALED
ncbi:MAG: thioredoxin [Acidobacteria bacterium]|nr:MAG: thioredoxin [Acidobacteriota bacterium]